MNKWVIVYLNPKVNQPTQLSPLPKIYLYLNGQVQYLAYKPNCFTSLQLKSMVIASFHFISKPMVVKAHNSYFISQLKLMIVRCLEFWEQKVERRH